MPDDIEDVIARNWDPTPGTLGAALAEPEVERLPDPYALADERSARETQALQRELLRHELFAAYPGLRGHDAALMAASAQLGEMQTGDPETIRATAKRLGEAASKLVGDIEKRVRRDDIAKAARSSRTAGIGGYSVAPALAQRRTKDVKPATLCDQIKAAQKRRGLY